MAQQWLPSDQQILFLHEERPQKMARLPCDIFSMLDDQIWKNLFQKRPSDGPCDSWWTKDQFKDASNGLGSSSQTGCPRKRTGDSSNFKLGGEGH